MNAAQNTVLSKLRRLKPELDRRYGVQKIGVFDCFMHESHDHPCDLNVLVELEKPLGWKFFELKKYVEFKLDLHIDIFTPNAIKPTLKEEIMHNIHFA